MTALTDLLISLSIWAAVGAAGWWGVWDRQLKRYDNCMAVQ